MSDFTDDEDRQLVQLAMAFASHGKLVSWNLLAARMADSAHSKSALRQRLKTLKRTHGTDLRKFPPWYFRNASFDASSRERYEKSATPAPKRSLPPLEYVCRSIPAKKARAYGYDCFWIPPAVRMSLSAHCENGAASSRMAFPAARPHYQENQSRVVSTLFNDREGALKLSSLELLADVAAQGRSHPSPIDFM